MKRLPSKNFDEKLAIVFFNSGELVFGFLNKDSAFEAGLN